MGRKKSKAAKIVDVITGNDEVESGPPAKELGGDWWVKMPLREFKDTIKTLTEPQLTVLLAAVREKVRELTLRQYVEDLPLEGQKKAGRLAPLYRGCVEAILTQIHGIAKPNDVAQG